jgi:hypothetical protein
MKMDGQRVFIFEYRRRGQTTQWDAIHPGHCVRCNAEDRWADQEVRVEEQPGSLSISVCCEEALEKNDATLAEELANEEFRRRLPGHTIVYEPAEEEQT